MSLRKVIVDGVAWRWRVIDNSDESARNRRELRLFCKTAGRYYKVAFDASSYPNGMYPSEVVRIIKNGC